jgi:hypothetical protein
MVLVDERMFKKMFTQKDRVLEDIDNEITNVLNSDQPDDLKAKLYSACTKRHNAISEPTVDGTPMTQTTETNAILNDVLLSMPPNYAAKSLKFIDFLKQKKIQFNQRGEMVHNKTAIPDSHAMDLIHEIIRKKSMHTAGAQEFAKILKGLNCPKELINNPKYRKYIQEGRGVGSICKKIVKACRKKKSVKFPKIKWSRY